MKTINLEDLNAAADVVYRHMTPTPQIAWPLLAQRCGCEVWVKHENHTPIGAFKARGGLVYMDALKREQPDVVGVISATRGNHGQSIALAAGLSGLACAIVVPHGNNPEKNNAMKALGAELLEVGHDFQEALERTADLAAERGYHMVPSFHRDLVRGVGTYAMELFGAVRDLDTLYVPIGLGSGINAVISARNALGLKTEIVGVVAENAAAYALSFESKSAVATNSADTVADGMACRVPNEDALPLIFDNAARIVRVSDGEIRAAMCHYFTDTHNLSEGAGAAALAALLRERDAMAGRKVGLILSGGNADRALVSDILSEVP